MSTNGANRSNPSQSSSSPSLIDKASNAINAALNFAGNLGRMGQNEGGAGSSGRRSVGGAAATPVTGKRAADSSFMAQSSRKRAKAMSAATNGKHRSAVPVEDPADLASPRKLEKTFEEANPANGRADASKAGAPSSSGAGEGDGKGTEPHAPKAPGVLSSLFSPVYNFFAGNRDGERHAPHLRALEAPFAQDEIEVADEDAEPKADGYVHDLAKCEEAEESNGAAAHHQHADEEEDDGDDEFDPYLFISTLPPLSSCVPEKRTPVLPRKARGSPRITLVLDLDETLVHSTLDDKNASDFSFPVHFHNQTHTVNVRRRPHLETFMEHVGPRFEVVIFTASQRVYAERLLDIIDPEQKYFAHRIFRDSCVYVDGNYLKDLTVLGRDLSRTIIVDNSPQAFGFQIDNGIPIESWFDDPQDSELPQLIPFLDQLAAAKDVRPLIKSHFRLAEKVKKAAEMATGYSRR